MPVLKYFVLSRNKNILGYGSRYEFRSSSKCQLWSILYYLESETSMDMDMDLNMDEDVDEDSDISEADMQVLKQSYE